MYFLGSSSTYCLEWPNYKSFYTCLFALRAVTCKAPFTLCVQNRITDRRLVASKLQWGCKKQSDVFLLPTLCAQIPSMKVAWLEINQPTGQNIKYTGSHHRSHQDIQIEALDAQRSPDIVEIYPWGRRAVGAYRAFNPCVSLFWAAYNHIVLKLPVSEMFWFIRLMVTTGRVSYKRRGRDHDAKAKKVLDSWPVALHTNHRKLTVPTQHRNYWPS